MKKILNFVMLILICLNSYAQQEEITKDHDLVKELLEIYEGLYTNLPESDLGLFTTSYIFSLNFEEHADDLAEHIIALRELTTSDVEYHKILETFTVEAAKKYPLTQEQANYIKSHIDEELREEHSWRGLQVGTRLVTTIAGLLILSVSGKVVQTSSSPVVFTNVINKGVFATGLVVIAAPNILDYFNVLQPETGFRLNFDHEATNSLLAQ